LRSGSHEIRGNGKEVERDMTFGREGFKKIQEEMDETEKRDGGCAPHFES